MEEIKKFIEKELFQNTNSEYPLHERVKSLIEAFKDNKTILLILHEHSNNLNPSNSAVSDILKREWFKTWGKNTIIQDDIPLIKHYFNSYTPKEQRVLMEKIELEAQTTLDKESIKDLQLKKMSEVDLALYHYKKGEIEPLKNYVKSIKVLSKSELNKIIDKLYDENSNGSLPIIKKGTLPIIVSLFNKTKPEHAKWIEKNLNTIHVLMQPKEDIEQYEEILIKYYTARCATYGTKDRSSENIRDEFVLSHLVKIKFDTYFSHTATEMYNNIRDLDNHIMLQVLENTDKYLKKYDFATEKSKKDNDIKGKGIDIVFNSLKKFSKRINNPGFNTSIANIENAYRANKQQKALRKELSLTLESNNPIKPKLKL